MATTPSKHRPVRPAVWTMWAPSFGILCLVGAHVFAASLGLYSSAPNVTILPATLAGTVNGQLEIAVEANDGPTGVGVRRVEYQLDEKAGSWTPLTLDKESRTYRGRSDLTRVKGGSHSLYLRASDFAGNLRTVSVSVKVNSAEASSSLSAPDSEHEPLADNKTIPQG